MVDNLAIDFNSDRAADFKNADPIIAVIAFICMAIVCWDDNTPNDFGTCELQELSKLIANRASETNLESDVCKSIGNYYAYQWK